ncbi:MAG: hypothetical protein KBF57_12035 [Saprospiraceae bacterium]|jgi:hypothetical protein|nr:hypothetical protein [Saprospiraceae bacterium]MBP9195407.1 hypothetical protein [Saprospiraceae bacterium]
MNIKTNIFIFLVSTGVDRGMAQIVPRGWKNEIRESTANTALIRKYTSSLNFDTQVAMDMDGYYRITARMLDSLARVLNSDLERQYQLSVIETLNQWPATEREIPLWKEDPFLEIEREYNNGLEAVSTLKRMAAKIWYKERTRNKFCFLPVRCAMDAIEHQHSSETDGQGGSSKNMKLGIQSEVSQYALYTDVYSDFFGPVSVGLGALVGLGGEQEDENDSFSQVASNPAAISRLVSGGGNVVLHLTYPLAYWNKPSQKLDFRIKVHPRIGVDLPTLGNKSSSYAMNLDLGLYSTLTYTGLNENIGLIAEFKLAGITGNDVFFKQLSLSDHRIFNLNQISLGLKLGKSFQITWIRYWGGIFHNTSQPAILSFSMAVN